MAIKDLCSEKVVSADKNMKIDKAALLMKRNNVGALVVTENESSKIPIGMITDRDIVINAIASGLPLTTKISQVMSGTPFTVDIDSGIAEVIEDMERNGKRRVILVDKSGEACGVVSADDLIQLLAREVNGIGQLIQRQPENEKRNSALSRNFIL